MGQGTGARFLGETNVGGRPPPFKPEIQFFCRRRRRRYRKEGTKLMSGT